jgi:hypothetical protein
VVDQLAEEYTGQPVIFLEQDVDNPVAPLRYYRWWSAFSGSYVILPMMMVDSGNQISNGYVNFYDTYKAMVEASLARPPKADITAYYTRIGDKLQFDITLTNQSGTTLSWDNNATVHAIVYEEAKVGLTSRYVRTAVYESISTPLANGDTAHFALTTDGINGVNWDNLHSVVLVDYQPSDLSGAYDTLQASVPEPGGFSVTPDPIIFLIDTADGSGGTVTMSLQGPSSLTWTVNNPLSWLEAMPMSGPIATPPTLSVVESNLSPGWQQGNITVSATNGASLNFQETIDVRAFYGTVEHIYLPLISK